MDLWGKLSKMKTKVYLGLDTSCYSTSIAAVDMNKNIIFNKTILLDVKAGEKGLRQSDAIFKHIKNFTTTDNVDIGCMFTTINYDKYCNADFGEISLYTVSQDIKNILKYYDITRFKYIPTSVNIYQY